MRTAPSNQWLRGSQYVWVHRLEPLAMYFFGSSLTKAGNAVLRTIQDPSFPGGRYFHELKEEAISKNVYVDSALLWETSCKIVGEKLNSLYLGLGNNVDENLLRLWASRLVTLVRMKYDNMIMTPR